MPECIRLPGGNALSPDHTGHDIIGASLYYWRDHDDFLAYLGNAHAELFFTNRPPDEMLMTKFYAVIEHYLATWRMAALHDHWTRIHGTIDVGVNVASAYVMLPSTMHALNTFMGLRKVPRVFAHLYTHAFVLNRITETEYGIGTLLGRTYRSLWDNHEAMVEVLSKGVETTPDTQ